jgi:two-component system LytT family response regulator
MTNKTIKAAIVEDEPKNTALLKKLLDMYCPQVNVCGHANSIETAVKLINEQTPDLVFLDIEISGGNAFELLDILRPVHFHIIFITAYDSYLLKAIKYSALDYLFKPVNIEELIAAVNKSSEKIQERNTSERIELLLKNVVTAKSPTAIALATESGFYLIPIENIMRCEASGNYTIFFTCDGKSHKSSKTLGEYEDLLPDNTFFRAHYSYLINIRFIAKYHKGKGGFIEMTDKTIIPLATRRKIDFINLFGAGV